MKSVMGSRYGKSRSSYCSRVSDDRPTKIRFIPKRVSPSIIGVWWLYLSRDIAQPTKLSFAPGPLVPLSVRGQRPDRRGPLFRCTLVSTIFFMPATNFANRFASKASHSHMTITAQPFIFNSSMCLESRSRFLAIIFDQYETFDSIFRLPSTQR
jgi:hypothetical protein